MPRLHSPLGRFGSWLVPALAAMALTAWPAGAELPRGTLMLAVRTCVAAQQTLRTPFPCLEVKLGPSGFAILRPPFSATHVVVMPIAPVSGIESRSLMKPEAGVYWRAALDARHFVREAAGPRVAADDIGFAINSRHGRSQDQLHIHLDCLRPEAVSSVRAREAELGPDWKQLAFRHFGPLWARTVGLEEIEGSNLFADLAARDAGLPEDMTLGLISAGPHRPRREFIALASRLAGASMETLLDHSCAIARRASAGAGSAAD